MVHAECITSLASLFENNIFETTVTFLQEKII